MKEKSKYIVFITLFVMLFTLSACSSSAATQEFPIVGFTQTFDFLVWPMAGLMWVIGHSIAFKQYALVIFFATIIVRSAAWPIYAKTNDMSLKMELMKPDLDKIEKRYRGKEDQESRQRKQMETMQLYKKYGVGVGGCLGSLIQLPIFLAFYQTLRRIPNTTSMMIPATGEVVKYALNFGDFSHIFLGIDLFQGRVGTFWSWQNIGIYILCILVAATQILNQILTSRRQKKQKSEVYSDVPAYRLPTQTDQQAQQGKIMQVMMYVMAAMMVVFVWQSPAALGLYWLVGNVFSLAQAYISFKLTSKNKEKLKRKYQR